jgi:hypothetical protein
MVLGLPWLQKINPDVDWQQRTVTLKKEASTVKKRGSETPALPEKNAKKASVTTVLSEEDKEKTKASQEMKANTEGRKRGGYGGDETLPKREQILKEKEYQNRLKETRDKLPEKLKDYADVFCQRK